MCEVRDYQDGNRDRLRILLLVSLLLLLSLSASSSADEVKWVGCGVTKVAFTRELAAAFEQHTSHKVQIRGGGAMKGIQDAAAGRTDIGGTCRYTLNDLSEEGAILNHVAWDALVLIVPDSNPVDNITLGQLYQIFDGKIDNWKQLDGEDHPIILQMRRGKQSGVGHMFRVMFYQDAERAFPIAKRLPRSTGLVEMMVRKGVGGLGITGYASGHKRNGVKLLSIEGVKPTKENIISGAYIYSRPLYFATGPGTSAAGEAFVRFALSDEGQKIISAEGVVNLAEGAGLAQRFRKRFGGQYLAPGVVE